MDARLVAYNLKLVRTESNGTTLGECNATYINSGIIQTHHRRHNQIPIPIPSLRILWALLSRPVVRVCSSSALFAFALATKGSRSSLPLRGRRMTWSWSSADDHASKTSASPAMLRRMRKSRWYKNCMVRLLLSRAGPPLPLPFFVSPPPTRATVEVVIWETCCKKSARSQRTRRLLTKSRAYRNNYGGRQVALRSRVIVVGICKFVVVLGGVIVRQGKYNIQYSWQRYAGE